MGSKYMVRTDEVRKYPLGDELTTDYYTNSLWQVVKLMVSKRGRILFITRWFW